MPAHRVYLVHEHDARRVALSLLKQIPHAARAHAHEHLHELRPAYGQKRHARLARNRPRQQRLARPRRPNQQHALGYLSPQAHKPLRHFQKLHHFLQLFLSLFHARHIRETHRRAVAHKHPRAALAKAKRLVAAALRLPHHKQQQRPEEYQRQEVDEQREQAAKPAGSLDIHRHARHRRIQARLAQRIHQARAYLFARRQRLA